MQIKPFIQLSRLQNGIWLFNFSFWPCAMGLAMAAFQTSMPIREFSTMTLVFLAGSVCFHACICTWNDICDMDIDGKVERTKKRPLAAGTVSIKAAILWMAMQLSVAVGLLALGNGLAFWAGLFSVFPLHTVYPLLKRLTYWPAGWLGIAFGWGSMVAWLSLTRNLEHMKVPIILCLANACWTIVYETIYQCQDAKDDHELGMKSTALLFGSSVRSILSLFAALSVALLLYAGLCNSNGLAYFAVTVGIYGIYLFHILMTFNPNEPRNCLSKFKENRRLGWIMWSGIVIDYLIKMY